VSKTKRGKAGIDPAADRDSAPTSDVLRFEVPYAASSPRLINPTLGLASLVPGPDPTASYTIDVTLLDSPDHRLIRCGVLLAHRVRDGLGEWYLSAHGWEPHLGGEQIEPMGQGDLPEHFADLVRPFRRIGPLGPVAALTAERRESMFQDVSGSRLARVRDERVTIRRGGLTTARFREVTVTPVGRGLDEAQRSFLTHTLTRLGASPVETFAPLVQRLGAPANGRSDYPAPRPLDDDGTVSGWSANLIATRLRAVIEADLSIRQGDATRVTSLLRAAGRLRGELAGLADLLDRTWLEDIDEELDWLLTTPAEDLAHRLRGERYLTLLEQLVTAARGPQIGAVAGERAKPALRSLLAEALEGLTARAHSASVEASNAEWQVLARALQKVLDVGSVSVHLNPKPVRRIRDRLLPLRELLTQCTGEELDGLVTTAYASSGAEAFELGRRYERELSDRLHHRRDWLDQWGRQSAKLSA